MYLMRYFCIKRLSHQFSSNKKSWILFGEYRFLLFSTQKFNWIFVFTSILLIINCTLGIWKWPQAQGVLEWKENDPTTTLHEGHFSLLLDHSDASISAWIHSTALTFSGSMNRDVGWDRELQPDIPICSAGDGVTLWAFTLLTLSSGDMSTFLHLRHFTSITIVLPTALLAGFVRLI